MWEYVGLVKGKCSDPLSRSLDVLSTRIVRYTAFVGIQRALSGFVRQTIYVRKPYMFYLCYVWYPLLYET